MAKNTVHLPQTNPSLVPPAVAARRVKLEQQESANAAPDATQQNDTAEAANVDGAPAGADDDLSAFDFEVDSQNSDAASDGRVRESGESEEDDDPSADEEDMSFLFEDGLATDPAVKPKPAPAPKRATKPKDGNKSSLRDILDGDDAQSSASQEVADLRAEMETLRAELTAAKEASTKPNKFEGFGEPPTAVNVPEELETTYAQARPYIEAIAHNIAASMLQDLMGQLHAFQQDYTGTRESLSGQMQDTRRGSFDAAMSARFPRLNSIVNHPSFAAYLNQVDPNTGESFGKTLKTASNKNDLASAAKVISRFENLLRKHGGKKQPDQSAFAGKKNGGATSASTSAAANADGRGGGQPKMLSWRRREDAFRKFRSGQITRDQLDKVQALYEAAEKEGRIDYDN